MKKIKKLLYICFIAFFMVILGSCGNNTATNPEKQNYEKEVVMNNVIYQLDEDSNCYAAYRVKDSKVTFVSIESKIDGLPVTSIKDYAFYVCEKLTNITIPSSIINIGDDAFYGCNQLEYNVYKNGKYIGNNENPYLVLMDTSRMVMSSFEINPNTRFIYSYALDYCYDLESITIPKGVKSIGAYAFGYCKKLTSITIPEGVTSIGNYAFDYCTNLTSLTIPSSVANVGYCAIPTIYNLQYNIYDNCKYLGNEENPYLLLVKTISKDITSCEIHLNTKIIYSNAFSDCEKLTGLTIPSNVVSIGYCAFWGCCNLTSITIPSSVTSIGIYAFYECYDFTDVYYTGSQKQWEKIFIDSYNEWLTTATIHYNYKEE